MYASTDGRAAATPSSTAGGWPGCGAMRWRPLEVAAIVLGFAIFWPVGLAMVAYKVWQKRGGDFADLADQAQSQWRSATAGWSRSGPFSRAQTGPWSFTAPGFSSRTGNHAFDAWREAEFKRLEEERAKLANAEREFDEYVQGLRRAKDQDDFDRFMQGRSQPGSSPAA